MNSEQIYNALQKYKPSIGLYYAIGIVQLRGGFRVSEVLKMKSSQIINDTDLYIVSDKGSRSKRVHVPEISKLLIKCKLYGINPFHGISRFQVYRMYKRLGIMLENKVGTKVSVTHAMRKNYIRDNYDSTKNIEVAAELVGHKSVKSTEYYVKNKEN